MMLVWEALQGGRVEEGIPLLKVYVIGLREKNPQVAEQT